ncbi:MAG: amylo-alpha-1,6-glucosidase [Bacteroidota bacterium]|jgi:glycogen debranching enzyme
MQRILQILLVLTAMSSLALAQLPTYTVLPQSAERLFCYTNKRAAFYAGVVNGPNSSGFHGITEEKKKLFEDYWIQLGDQLLDRRTAEIEITPAGFRRRYPLYNTVEDVLFSDSLTLLSVIVQSEYRGGVKIYPAMSVWWQDATQSRRGDIYWLFKQGIQGAAAVNGMAGDWEILRPRDLEAFSNPAPMYMPLVYYGQSTGTFTFTVSFFLAGLPPVNRDQHSVQRLRLDREKRITTFLSGMDFSCSDAASTRAFQWIAASMDALVMRQSGVGIYAGLPWFDDYWGRDTFIAFPGALLVTGRFERARDVLRSFLTYMDRDSTSPTYGRIPNRIQPYDVIYNTVDGTPWMVIQAMEYYRYSGDKEFLREIFPDVERTIAGALRHTDEHLLLTHADAETWMDAVGPGGPWSPRGNRALDIQALWYSQLRAASKIAAVLGDATRSSGWARFADKVRASVLEYYVDAADMRIHDHLNSDETHDLQIRPNIFLPFTIPGSDIFDGVADSVVRAVIRRTFAETVFPFGVASLSQDDGNFHPWHEAPRFYVKDAAYHNGTIWTWLTGPTVSTLIRFGMQDSAWVLTQSLQRLAMDVAAVGTIPECTDALPHDGEHYPRWSGTFSQAWSDAEYLRNWYQDYLGAVPDWTAEGIPVLTLNPALPSALLAHAGDSIAATVRIGNAYIRVLYRQDAVSRSIQLRHIAGATAVRITAGSNAPIMLVPGAHASIPYPESSTKTAAFTSSLPLFALPRSTADIPALQPPPWPRIEGATANVRNDTAQELCSSFDAEGDDKGGDGIHTYPTNALFSPGIADLRWFDVRSDNANVYFTIRMQTLAQPGWHPEYGFQLTLLAIAIDQSHDPAKQSTSMGFNSGYVFPEGRGYDRLILVGGGVRVVDAKGDILCEFIPETSADAFGDVDTATIRFAIPREFLGGGFDHWQYTVLSGLQDDHGGAGIGEFRSVLPQAAEWNGGGTAGANWYDIMLCPK